VGWRRAIFWCVAGSESPSCSLLFLCSFALPTSWFSSSTCSADSSCFACTFALAVPGIMKLSRKQHSPYAPSRHRTSYRTLPVKSAISQHLTIASHSRSLRFSLLSELGPKLRALFLACFEHLRSSFPRIHAIDLVRDIPPRSWMSVVDEPAPSQMDAGPSERGRGRSSVGRRVTERKERERRLKMVVPDECRRS